MNAHRQTVLGWVGALAVCVLLAAAPLAAGTSPWYLDGKLGRTSFAAGGLPLFGPQADGEDALAGFEVGYTLHRFVSLQAGYSDLGRFEGRGIPRGCSPDVICILIDPPPLIAPTPVEAEVTAFSLSAVPQWPLTDRLSIFGKLGVVDWEAELFTAADGARIQRTSELDVLAGLGARYVFPKGFGVLLEYEDSDLVSAVSLGASWRF